MALVEDRYVTTTQTTDSNVAFLGQSSLVDVESIESPMGDMGTTVSISENPIAEIPRPEPLPDIKNIMITGGNGFLYHPQDLSSHGHMLIAFGTGVTGCYEPSL